VKTWRDKLAAKLRAAARPGAFLLVAAAAFHVAWPPWYEYPPPAPFAGPRWHDPLAGEGQWLKTNLHAHSEIWFGPLYGDRPPAEVRQLYRELGYDVYALSNYQHVTPRGPDEEIYVTCYEHGYGIQKIHHTVVGAERATPLDLPLLQTLAGKQQVFDWLRPTAPVVILNHPTMRWAFAPSELAELCGYTGLEIRSKYAKAVPHWDAALSAGRLVWGFATDDGHRQERQSHIGIGWVVAKAAARSGDALIEALQRGRFYAVFTRQRERPNELLDLRLSEGPAPSLTIRCRDVAESIRFVGQGGVTLAEVRGSAEGTYSLRPEDAYVRIEVETRGTQLFTNPVYRYEGDDPYARAALRARPIPSLTWLKRLVGLAVTAAAGVALLARRRPAQPEDEGEPAGEQRNST